MPFWSELDYIGVDAYFPISLEESPTLEQLETGWQPLAKELEAFSDPYQRPILFTEYGYRSATQCAGKHWEITNQASADMKS